jgi:WD40 repeat protein
VQIWDVNTGRIVHRLAGVHQGECRRVTFSPDGSQFATSGGDHGVKIWETSSAKLLRTLDGHESVAGSLKWSPDSRRFLSGDWNRYVRIWDTATWECLWDLREPESSGGAADGGNCAAWSPDSQRIVTRSGTGDLVVWQLNEDQPPVRIWTTRAHSSNIRSIDWSPDGRRIATSSEDSFVKVWDAATGREMLSFDHAGWVQKVGWSPDGSRLGIAVDALATIVIHDARKARGVNWDERTRSEDQDESAAREPHQ